MKVQDNLEVFKEYNAFQKKIDECNKLISQLKIKQLTPSFSLYGWDIQQVLGEHLYSKLGSKLIAMIEVERIELETQQSLLEIK